VLPSIGAGGGIFCILRWRWKRKKAKARAARPRAARAIPTPNAALEPVERPEEAGLPSLLRGRLVCDEEVVLDAPGLAEVGERVPELEEESEGDEGDDNDEEEDVLDDVDDDVVEAATCQPLIWTPITWVEPSTVLVSDHGPASVRV
jgi:hypothetical protein